ncbi:hypothetical protein KQH81_07920 [Clostridium cadaveris]|uniref:hypothetical protein n=1 Tax=Clostridium cadaveris TaxID=1529 RepID=UPI001E581A74|nr:hypothetical protein [Clostridium cadaveris]UFH66437.1 hypothetical protein KQH81_07920 [Clostridium cadaveris]
MREIKLIDIDYNTKFIVKEDVLKNKYLDGDNFINDNLIVKKEVYSADELINQGTSNIDINIVVDNFIKTFKKRNIEATEEQIHFAKETASIIFNELKENIITIIPAPPGFGKSTIKTEILKAMIYQYENNINSNGVIITADRLEDLKEIQKELGKKYTYLLEGWNEEICTFSKKLEIGMCKKCTNQCKVKKQTYEQSEYPILLVTNARLKDCGESINRYKEYKDGKRNLLLIDERPAILDTTKIDRKLLNDIDSYISNLKYEDLTDKTMLLKYWREITDLILNNMSSLRGKYKRFIISNNSNIGVCKDNYNFMKLWNKHVKYEYKRELDHIHDILTQGGLYVCEKNTEFIARIGNKNLQQQYCNDFKTIIFDGSSLIDPQYISLIRTGQAKYLDIENTRTYENLNLFIFTAHKLTKTEFTNKKYLIKAVAKFINNRLKEGLYINYVVCPQEQALQLSNLLNDTLKKTVVKNDDGRCFYFGATKGSNKMSKCTRMFQVGWDTMPDYEYAIQFLCTCIDWNLWLKSCLDLNKAIYFSEKLEVKDRSLLECSSGTYKSFNNDYSFGITSLNNFKMQDIVAKFYQEIHRTRLREYSYDGEIKVILFQNKYIIYQMIQQMFPKCNLSYRKDKLKEFKRKKSDNRKNRAKGYDEFMKWFDTWNGEEIKAGKIKEICNIDNEQFKTLQKNEAVKDIIATLYSPKKGYYSK